KSAPPLRMDQEIHNELRRKNIYFHCKDPWEHGHHYLGKGKVHLIEVVSDVDDEQLLDIDLEDNDNSHDEGNPQIYLGE
ncbi:hypothetical protein KI387_018774, partial [Taxus chinensis]